MKRLSAVIILFANIVILVHAAIPHYHGDDMIATIMHLTECEEDHHGHDCDGAPSTHAGCHHTGDESHDDGHCMMNDTMMASACRSESFDFGSLQQPLLCIIINTVMMPEPSVETTEISLNLYKFQILKGPELAVGPLRAPPAL